MAARGVSTLSLSLFDDGDVPPPHTNRMRESVRKIRDGDDNILLSPCRVPVITAKRILMDIIIMENGGVVYNKSTIDRRKGGRKEARNQTSGWGGRIFICVCVIFGLDPAPAQYFLD